MSEDDAIPTQLAQDQMTQDQLARDIERTRGELALTLDALEEKLAPRHLVEKGLDMFNSIISQDGLNRSLDAIRANPVPVALIGIGAAWLIANNTNVVERLASDERVEATRRRVVGLASDVGTRAGELASGVANSVATSVGLGGSAGQGANDDDSPDRPLGHTGHPLVDQTGASQSTGWMHQVSDLAQDSLRTARDSGEAVLERASGYASDGASRIAGRVSDAFDKHPLAIGAIGVMAGALIAALLPRTQTEDELIGSSSDELWSKAREAGGEAVTRVRQVASQVAEQAIDAASHPTGDGAEGSPSGKSKATQG